MPSQWFDLSDEQEARARRLQASSLIIDALSGRIVYPEPHPVDGKAYLDRLLEAGYRAVNVTLAAHASSSSFEEALVNINGYYSLFTAKPDKTLHVQCSNDILRAKEENKVGVIFGFQNAGTPIGEKTWRWAIVHKLGLRICQLTYSEGNVLASGCKERHDHGLSAYGQQAIGEMNRLGIVLDLSHLGERSSFEAMEVSEDPVIFSHSNPRAIGPSFRNISDEQIRACAQKQGVIGLTPHSELCHKTPGVRPTVEDYLDHIDYVVGLVGIDHVGIGTDVYESYTKISWEAKTKRTYKSAWVYETMLSDGFSRVTDISNVIRGLVKRGYGDDDIEKFLGRNWLRVFSQVWDKTVAVA